MKESDVKGLANRTLSYLPCRSQGRVNGNCPTGFKATRAYYYPPVGLSTTFSATAVKLHEEKYLRSLAILITEGFLDRGLCLQFHLGISFTQIKVANNDLCQRF